MSHSDLLRTVFLGGVLPGFLHRFFKDFFMEFFKEFFIEFFMFLITLLESLLFFYFGKFQVKTREKKIAKPLGRLGKFMLILIRLFVSRNKLNL